MDNEILHKSDSSDTIIMDDIDVICDSVDTGVNIDINPFYIILSQELKYVYKYKHKNIIHICTDNLIYMESENFYIDKLKENNQEKLILFGVFKDISSRSVNSFDSDYTKLIATVPSNNFYEFE